MKKNIISTLICIASISFQMHATPKIKETISPQESGDILYETKRDDALIKKQRDDALIKKQRDDALKSMMNIKH